MTTEITPINNLDQIGLVIDAPSIALPPNAFSDALNVRFDDGAIRKVRGFQEIFANHGLNDIQYLAYWPNPNRATWVVVNRQTISSLERDVVYTITLTTAGAPLVVNRSPTAGYAISTQWQHTIFNGGYTFIINNGSDKPQYITATQGTQLRDTALEAADRFADLPGWDSYQSGSVTATNLAVRARIVVSFGNLLMAGSLVEVDTSDNNSVVRNLRGVVRSSNVATLGSIPDNWNPFATGANTADEILIADTGEITAMAPLQGRMMVYTADSITQITVTGQGLSETNITREYGATGIGSVFEYDGRHVVQGSNDIYTFEGHPASIQSISDSRVRRFYYRDVHGSFTDRTRIVRDQTYDEIWICYVSNANNFGRIDSALMWNYRSNVWSRRSMPNLSAIAVGPVEGGGVDTENFVFDTSHRVDNGVDVTTTGTASAGVAEVQRATIAGGTLPGGTLEVQSSTISGTRSNSVRGTDEIFTLTLPNNFQAATGVGGSINTASAPTSGTPASGASTMAIANNFAGFTGLDVRVTRTGRTVYGSRVPSTSAGSGSWNTLLNNATGTSSNPATGTITVSANTAAILVEPSGNDGDGNFGVVSYTIGALSGTRQRSTYSFIIQGPAYQSGDNGINNNTLPVSGSLAAGTYSVSVTGQRNNAVTIREATRTVTVVSDDVYAAQYNGDQTRNISIGGNTDVPTSFVNINAPDSQGNYLVTATGASNTATAMMAANPPNPGMTMINTDDFAGFVGLTIRNTRVSTENRSVGVAASGIGWSDNRGGDIWRPNANTVFMDVSFTPREHGFANGSYLVGDGSASVAVGTRVRVRGPAWRQGDGNDSFPQIQANGLIAFSTGNGASFLAATRTDQTVTYTPSTTFEARYTGASTTAIQLGGITANSSFQTLSGTTGTYTVTSGGTTATAPTGDNPISNFGGVTGLTVLRDSDGTVVANQSGTTSRNVGGVQVTVSQGAATAGPTVQSQGTGGNAQNARITVPSTSGASFTRIEYAVGAGNNDSGLTAILFRNGAEVGRVSQRETSFVSGTYSGPISAGDVFSVQGGEQGRPNSQVVTLIYNVPTFNVVFRNNNNYQVQTTSGTTGGSRPLNPSGSSGDSYQARTNASTSAWTLGHTSQQYRGTYTGAGTVTVGGTRVTTNTVLPPPDASNRYAIDTGAASSFQVNLDTGNVGVFPNLVGGTFSSRANRATAYAQIDNAIRAQYPTVTTEVVNNVLRIDTNQEQNLAGSYVGVDGNGGSNTNPPNAFGSEFQDGLIVTQGSTYTVVAPDLSTVGSFTSSVPDESSSDLTDVISMATNLVTGYVSSDNSVSNSTVDSSTTPNMFEITNGVTGDVSGVWSIVPMHPTHPVDSMREGDIAFTTFMQDTQGVLGGSYSATITLPDGTTERMFTVANNTTTTTNGHDLLATAITTALDADQYSAEVSSGNLDITRDVVGNVQGTFALALSAPVQSATLPTVMPFTQQTRGDDPTVAGRLSVTEISPERVRTPIIDNMALTGQTAVQIAEIVRNAVDATDAFEADGIGENAGVRTTAFGPSAPGIEVEFTLGTFLNANGVASTNVGGVATEDNIYVTLQPLDTRDLERPWPSTFINEGFNFVVGASRQSATAYQLFAFDVGSSANGSDIVSYVERKNIHVRPTKDTEMLQTIYLDSQGDMGSDTDTPQYTIRVNITNAAGLAETVDLSRDTGNNVFTFNYGGMQSDYKTDVRLTGRILNFRVEDTSQLDWSIAEMGLEVGKGGTR